MSGLRSVISSAFVLRLALGGIFIAASLDKIMHPADFAEIVRGYRILPPEFVNTVAITLPWVELLLGVLLIFGSWLSGGFLLANGLLAFFLWAVLYSYARGLDISCGCFSTQDKSTGNMIWYMIRDSLFLLLGLSAWWSNRPRERFIYRSARRW